MMPVLGFAVIVLLALCVYGAAERRRGAKESAIPLPSSPARWTRGLESDGTQPPAEERIAIAERLGLVASAWSLAALEDALAEEPDARVRDAIWRTLIAARSDEATSFRST